METACATACAALAFSSPPASTSRPWDFTRFTQQRIPLSHSLAWLGDLVCSWLTPAHQTGFVSGVTVSPATQTPPFSRAQQVVALDGVVNEGEKTPC
jgi:hypothetical protein